MEIQRHLHSSSALRFVISIGAVWKRTGLLLSDFIKFWGFFPQAISKCAFWSDVCCTNPYNQHAVSVLSETKNDKGKCFTSLGSRSCACLIGIVWLFNWFITNILVAKLTVEVQCLAFMLIAAHIKRIIPLCPGATSVGNSGLILFLFRTLMFQQITITGKWQSSILSAYLCRLLFFPLLTALFPVLA